MTFFNVLIVYYTVNLLSRSVSLFYKFGLFKYSKKTFVTVSKLDVWNKDILNYKYINMIHQLIVVWAKKMGLQFTYNTLQCSIMIEKFEIYMPGFHCVLFSLFQSFWLNEIPERRSTIIVSSALNMECLAMSERMKNNYYGRSQK